MLRPDVALELAGEIIQEATPYLRTRRAAQATLAKMRSAAAESAFPLSKLELRWLDRLSRAADGLPADEAELTAQMLAVVDRGKVHVEEYGVALINNRIFSISI